MFVLIKCWFFLPYFSFYAAPSTFSLHSNLEKRQSSRASESVLDDPEGASRSSELDPRKSIMPLDSFAPRPSCFGLAKSEAERALLTAVVSDASVDRPFRTCNTLSHPIVANLRRASTVIICTFARAYGQVFKTGRSLFINFKLFAPNQHLD
ncbi:hypothetical protein B0H17DRAFT_422822 [Mycena rosella]|uniref:Secreted protein n=1 Tax=Mycena rosella TaxID=1033263 RepID=A0AAD7GN56_MYCRO|nr:hypothetical protein B0H17DRAFT_422822 [Mycena rosella]